MDLFNPASVDQFVNKLSENRQVLNTESDIYNLRKNKGNRNDAFKINSIEVVKRADTADLNLLETTNFG